MGLKLGLLGRSYSTAGPQRLVNPSHWERMREWEEDLVDMQELSIFDKTDLASSTIKSKIWQDPTITVGSAMKLIADPEQSAVAVRAKACSS